MFVDKSEKVEIKAVVEQDELLEDENLIEYDGAVWLVTDENTAVRIWGAHCKKHIDGLGMVIDLTDVDESEITQFSGSITLTTK